MICAANEVMLAMETVCLLHARILSIYEFASLQVGLLPNPSLPVSNLQMNASGFVWLVPIMFGWQNFLFPYLYLPRICRRQVGVDAQYIILITHLSECFVHWDLRVHVWAHQNVWHARLPFEVTAIAEFYCYLAAGVILIHCISTHKDSLCVTNATPQYRSSHSTAILSMSTYIMSATRDVGSLDERRWLPLQARVLPGG